MPQKKGKDGKFKSAIARELISIRLLPEIAEKLRNYPNRSKYIEAVLYEKAAFCASPDPDWDYYQEWERILDLFLFAGSALLKVQQCEERSEMGDDAIALLEKNIEKWLREGRD